MKCLQKLKDVLRRPVGAIVFSILFIALVILLLVMMQEESTWEEFFALTIVVIAGVAISEWISIPGKEFESFSPAFRIRFTLITLGIFLIGLVWWGGMIVQIFNNLSEDKLDILLNYANISLVVGVAVGGFLISNNRSITREHNFHLQRLTRSCFNFTLSAMSFLFVYAMNEFTLDNFPLSVVVEYVKALALIFGPWCLILGFINFFMALLIFNERLKLSNTKNP